MKSKKFKLNKEDWQSVLRVFLYNLLAFIPILCTTTVWPVGFAAWYTFFIPVVSPVIAIIMKWLQTSEGGLKTIVKSEPDK